MKKTTIAAATAATALLMGTTVLAGPIEDLIAQLEAEGYANIEVDSPNAAGEVEIEALLGDMEREITLDAEGNIIEDTTEPVEHDEDDDEDEEDEEDDNAEDEDDDDDDDDDEEEDGN